MATILANNSAIELAAVEAVKTCFDPEIPVNIYELGLIYEISEKEGVVNVKMTLTSPNCPAAESLPGEVKAKILGLEGVKEAHVDVVFEPPWDKDMMSDEAKLELGFW
jgi:FeS assembly SUF system protein